MARNFITFPSSTIFLVLLSLFVLINYCLCLNPKLLNVTTFYQINADFNWHRAGATWYGPPRGAGSDGGACGYLDAVKKPPFFAMISAGGPSIYQSGKGCGVCYQVKCTENGACSGNPVTITITDECPGCTSEAAHFDLSGTAFGALAKPGLDQKLRDAGVLNVQYRLVECNYRGVTIAIRVDSGSNPYYFAGAIEYEDGTGIAKVELQPHQSSVWMGMHEVWGAVWGVNSGSQLQPPYSIKLTEKDSGNVVILSNIIPVGWQSGQTYRSRVNFK